MNINNSIPLKQLNDAFNFKPQAAPLPEVTSDPKETFQPQAKSDSLKSPDHTSSPLDEPKAAPLHTKTLIIDTAASNPAPPGQFSPWAKNESKGSANDPYAIPNNCFFSGDNSVIFQDADVVSHELGHAALNPPGGKTLAEILNEISSQTSKATEGKTGSAAEAAAQASLEKMASMKESWQSIDNIIAEGKAIQAEGHQQMAAGSAKAAAGMAGMMMGAMGGVVGAMGGVGGMLGGMFGYGGMGVVGMGMGGLDNSSIAGGVVKTAQAQASAPAAPVAAIDPVQAAETQRLADIKQAVTEKLTAMDARASFKVDKQLLPLLDKMNMDPVDFFTARACWQGVHTKRRAVLEKVLDQFPDLPKDQKNLQGAMAAAEAKGTKISETDRYFLKYFFEHRKEMKTLFRATLNLFEGDKVSVYRGQSNSSEYGKDSTKPLGCYSFNPSTSASWGSNLKRFRVNINDVWSTSVVSQNQNRSEEEVTVYSRGGIRKGTPISKEALPAELQNYKDEVKPNEYMKLAMDSWW